MRVQVGRDMGFWVYVLRCVDGSYYTGHTDDLEKRLTEHEAGEGGSYTAARLPVTLAYSEKFPSRDEASARERQIKGWTRRKKEAMLRRDWTEVSRLANGKKSGQTT
jgi:predicted GIY-YIG superfamily endonuclease